jgi:hypothetical protein
MGRTTPRPRVLCPACKRYIAIDESGYFYNHNPIAVGGGALFRHSRLSSKTCRGSRRRPELIHEDPAE